ncbi:hypothetical protein VP01_4891g1, partial [Puccinia sorghi]
ALGSSPVSGKLQQWEFNFSYGNDKFICENEINLIVLECLGCTLDVDELTMVERITCLCPI